MSSDSVAASGRITLPSVFTTALWLVVATAGVMGLRLQYQQAQARKKLHPPMVAQKMDVRLIGSSASPSPTPHASAQPELKELSQSPPPTPAMPSFLAPMPLIPVAIPSVQSSTPAIAHLTFGSNTGSLPAPEYPPEARIAHQQGSVVVRFFVDDNGKVKDVHASSPCQYSLLNEAAVRAVRDTWPDPPVKTGLYDVTFQFELHQK